jgi:hypothetical protein
MRNNSVQRAWSLVYTRYTSRTRAITGSSVLLLVRWMVKVGSVLSRISRRATVETQES